jgi:hypothetical protein
VLRLVGGPSAGVEKCSFGKHAAVGVDDQRALQIAADQSASRSANERMRQLVLSQRFELDQRAPFVCECPDRGCREIVMLSLVDYERVRQHPSRFLLMAGHEDAEAPWERVIEVENGCAIVEKVGLAGVEAARLNPRQGGVVS